MGEQIAKASSDCRFAFLLMLLFHGGLVNSGTAQDGPAPVEPPVSYELDEQRQLLEFLTKHGGGIVVAEAALQPVMSRETKDNGPVQDQILGAYVLGTQSTTASSSLDLVPNNENARWFIHLRGKTQNCTTSYTPQAIIRSQGEYLFQLSKQVDLTGTTVMTRSPAAFMETHQRNFAAHTPADTIPLVGPLVGMAAFMEAENRRPLAERIAAHRLTERIAPTFNSEADASLVRLNNSLAQLRGKWPNGVLQPPTIHSRSTQSAAALAIDLGDQSVTTAQLDWPLVNPQSGVAILLSEQRLNSWLARLPIAGQQFRDTDIDLLVNRIQGKSASGPTLPGAGPGQLVSLATLILDEQRPLAVQFLDNYTLLELRMRVRPAVGDELPTQVIRLRFDVRQTESAFEMKASVVEVVPLQPELSQVAHDLARNVLKQQLEQRLKPVSIPRQIPVPEAWSQTGVSGIEVSQFTSRNGWLSLVLQPKSATPE
ncbi:MAG: hypothetical protein R3C18_14365 [Planctomycetaceae bacterium]